MNNYKTGFVLLIISCLSLIFPSCLSNKTDVEDSNLRDTLFPDRFEKGEYFNEVLNFRIQFSNDWQLKIDSSQFTASEKEYAEYFKSVEGEVLFIGYHDDEKIGVRSTCELVQADYETHFKNLQKITSNITKKYQVKFKQSDLVTFTTFEAYQVIFDLVINENNQYTFDSLYFKNNSYLIKLEFWMEKDLYENKVDFLKSIKNSISIGAFHDAPKSNPDLSTDITSK
ncbi:MAG: hypothetical protein MJB14_03645 [Spirochaetes bacterium]|nr:hypothetical protein [Spirochaetota bacterium]